MDDVELTPLLVTARIKFGEHVDVEAKVGMGTSIEEMRKLIRKQRPELEDRRLRIIYQGRILPTNSTVKEAYSFDNVSQSSGGLKRVPEVLYFHCSVGEPGSRSAEESDEGIKQGISGPAPRGFERLEPSFQPEDVRQLRVDFHRSRGREISDNPGILPESYLEAEDQWLDNTPIDNNSDLDSGVDDVPFGMLVLFITLGYFCGLMSIVLCNLFVPPQQRTKRLVFVGAGALVNLAFGLLR